MKIRFKNPLPLLALGAAMALSACGAEMGDEPTDEIPEQLAETGEFEELDVDMDVDESTEDPEQVEETDELASTEEDMETRANWNIHAQPQPGGTSVSVSWETQLGLTYKLCWKKTGQWGDACWYNNVDVTANSSNTWSGVTYAGIYGLECGGTGYKVKAKKGWSSDSTTFSTAACGCSNPCPQGGYYDGANCQIGKAPAGTTAFIWSNNYYYTALPGNSCPYPGSWYDGANCYVQAVPSGVNPFIYANHWYYQSCP